MVVTIITPLAPRDPYIAVAEASFKTTILSISLGLIKFNGFLDPPTPPSFNGIPSTTKRGLLDRLNDPLPRILIICPSPGAPLPEVTETPAILPIINCWADTKGP